MRYGTVPRWNFVLPCDQDFALSHPYSSKRDSTHCQNLSCSSMRLWKSCKRKGRFPQFTARRPVKNRSQDDSRISFCFELGIRHNMVAWHPIGSPLLLLSFAHPRVTHLRHIGKAGVVPNFMDFERKNPAFLLLRFQKPYPSIAFPRQP